MNASVGITALTLLTSAAVAQTPDHPGVVYAQVGAHQLRLDVHLPENADELSPAVFWIHGGGWRNGSRDGIGPATFLLERDVAVISIDYRLTSADWSDVSLIWPAQIHDVKGAVRFIRAHGLEYGIDATRLAAWGQSAGGHLAAMLALSGDVPELEGDVGGNLDQSSRVLAAVAYYGPTNLIRLELDVTDPPGSVVDHDAPDAPESQLIGWDAPGQGVGDLRANIENPTPPYPALADLIASASPVNFATPDDPPLMIAHGAADLAVPPLQSVRLAAACADANVEHAIMIVQDRGHANLGFDVNTAAADFLAAALSAPCIADLDEDGVVNLDDVNLVLNAWNDNDMAGDVNADGLVDVRDLNAVLSSWSDGCDH